jgi:hypothetical protein
MAQARIETRLCKPKLDHTLTTIIARSDNIFGVLAIFLLGMLPLYKVDSSTKANFLKNIKISQVEATLCW